MFKMFIKVFYFFDKEGFIEIDLKFYQFLMFFDSFCRLYNQFLFLMVLLVIYIYMKNGCNGNGIDSLYYFYCNIVKVFIIVYFVEYF